MQSKDFSSVFTDAISDIERQAKEIGLNLTTICRQAKISRATPDRWRKNPPKTVRLVAEMQRIVDEHRQKVQSATGA